MAEPKTQLHDPRILRAIAHPVRSRMLTELGASGPLRAVDLAELLGIPANQASFHLRQLAKYGLVEEDPAAARDRRDRVWKLTSEHGFTVQLGDVEESPGGRAAARVLLRQKAAWGHVIVDEAHGDDRTPGFLRSVGEQAVRLTKAEAEELNEEMQTLADRWIDKTRGRDRDDGRSTYLLYTILMPYPEHH